MPSKRKQHGTQRAPQNPSQHHQSQSSQQHHRYPSQHAPQQSDYETDTAASLPLAPPPAGRTNTELNLSVLRRYFPNIATILAIAPFIVVYSYVLPSEQQSQGTGGAGGGWEKIGVEGTGFVCALQSDSTPPSLYGYEKFGFQYALIILNRKSLDNFVIPLSRVQAEDIEITDEYVIVPVTSQPSSLEAYEQEKELAPVVYGLWIFNEEAQMPDGSVSSTREMVAAKIVECALLDAQQPLGEHDDYGDGIEDEYGAYEQEGNGASYGDQLNEYTSDEAAGHAGQPQPEKQIDLMALFNNSGGQPQGSTVMSPHYASVPQDQFPQQTEPSQPTRFSATTDTDFFRSTGQPATMNASQGSAVPQQNMLLDLFKSAKKV